MMTTFFLFGGLEALIGPLLVLLSWGGGLSIHAMRVFGLFGLGSPAWEEEKVKELMRSGDPGLTKAEMNQVLRQALIEVAQIEDRSSVVDERTLQRLEHLEAIVTSEDWELLQEEKVVEDSHVRVESDHDSETAQEVDRLAKRVR